METKVILDNLIERYPKLAVIKDDIFSAYQTIKTCFKNGNTLYVCGNGGSCADAEHICGELLKSFKIKRPLLGEFKDKLKTCGDDGVLGEKLERGFPVVSLCGHPAFTTAFLNDSEPDLIYAQQINCYGKSGDVLLCISTSGNAKNCNYACIVAKALGMNVVLLSGKTGGIMKGNSDVSIIVPANETYLVQELHLPVYHALCAMLENEFFTE